ncbi:hypothetical protein L484_015630 [Morus notabilis]|uniref:Uncharacterized protein n=1 Tax=Morus notabilis TaxID=981085 RepID=W9QYE4_9ROSA|nr:hypothetical protein L484_015630 [Morus notabilis]
MMGGLGLAPNPNELQTIHRAKTGAGRSRGPQPQQRSKGDSYAYTATKPHEPSIDQMPQTAQPRQNPSTTDPLKTTTLESTMPPSLPSRHPVRFWHPYSTAVSNRLLSL